MKRVNKPEFVSITLLEIYSRKESKGEKHSVSSTRAICQHSGLNLDLLLFMFIVDLWLYVETQVDLCDEIYGLYGKWRLLISIN